PVNTLSPEFATEIFHRSDTLVGWFIGVYGIGAVLAGIWVSGQPLAGDRQLATRQALIMVGFVVFASTSLLPVAIVGLVLGGFAFIATSAAALTRVQQRTDPSEHGRLMAVWSMAFMGSRPLAGVVGGAIASFTGVRIATYVLAVPSALAASIMWRRGATGILRRTHPA
ncbi:MAG TPA: MFS transporter, partial [Ilumatobacteraceae bacterium]|nr:MFS transporter [Ilumatobacteraceae bacterium]